MNFGDHHFTKRLLARACLFMICLCFSGSSISQAAIVQFSTFSGPTAPITTAGAMWRFDDVTTGVDMLVELTSLTAGATLNDFGVGTGANADDFRVAIEGNWQQDNFAEFAMTFVEADTFTSTIIDADFVVTDLDEGFRYQEALFIDNVSFYTLDQNTQVSVLPQGNGSLLAFNDQNGNLDPEDQIGWFGAGLRGVSGFDLTWGAFGTSPNNVTFPRGMFLDGDGDNVFTNGVTYVTKTPEPHSAQLLLFGIITISYLRRKKPCKNR